MEIAEGTIAYTIGSEPVKACGLSYSIDELNEALAGPVKDAVFDSDGTSTVEKFLSGLAETDFEHQSLERILTKRHEPEPWRVGEALAETYLVHHCSCMFPWPDSRDERKSGSSLPGADLVGFQTDGQTERFAFGEVKTSGEDKYPPQAMYGRTGLKQQLEDLRDDERIRDDLVLYLCHRAINTDWMVRYRNAYKRYASNSADVVLFGLMVRDVEPHCDDLRARTSMLAKNCPVGMKVDLLSIYLPSGAIEVLPERLANASIGGTAS